MIPLNLEHSADGGTRLVCSLWSPNNWNDKYQDLWLQHHSSVFLFMVHFYIPFDVLGNPKYEKYLLLHHETPNIENKCPVDICKKKKWTNFGWGNFWSQPVWFGSPLLPELKCESHKRPQMDFHCQNKWSGYRGSIAYLSIALHHFSQHLNKLNSALYQPVCINSISAPKQITLFPNKSSFCADI